MTSKKVLIIIPTYNEKENIREIIAAIFKVNANYHLLIVDDNSPDKTWQIVERLAKNDYRINLIRREFRQGLGPAYILGFQYGIRKKYDYLIQMDADFSHDPKMIPVFLKEIKNCDLVIGSRYVRGGSIKGWEFKRKLLSWLGNSYTKLVLGFSIKDWTSGFCCWKKEILEKMNLNNKEFPSGYAFLIALKYKALKANLKIEEMPIIFRDRQLGSTKMGGTIVNEAILTIIRLRMNQ